jgi:hypothetical protein
MLTRQTLLCGLVVASGAAVSEADVFVWAGGSGVWENPGMWSGPAGQFPDSILDTATVGGANAEAYLTQNLALGTLNVINGGSLVASGRSVFVNADTMLSGIGSAISIMPSAALRDFDTDTLTVNAAIFVLNSATAQFDEALVVNGNGSVAGTGTIEMNSTTGDLDLNDGSLWAVGGTGPDDTLRVVRTGSSSSKLDWTSAGARVAVWDAKTLRNELPYAGALGGTIGVVGTSGTARFVSDAAFVAGASSEIRLAGGGSQSTARVEAPVVDSHGVVDVSGHGVVNAPLVALRGSVEMGQDAFLSIPAGLLVFDSLGVTAAGPGAAIQLAQPDSTLSVIGGLTSIVLGPDSVFDLDGGTDKAVNIANGSTLSLAVGAVDFGGLPSFGGTLNVDGTLHVEAYPGIERWRSHGQIVLDTGTITGRRIDNAGVIRGTGSISAPVVNNGEIIADGGTLSMGLVVTDGDATPATGVLRAETGDLVMNMADPDALHYFTGTAFVGDGAGVREVLQMNASFLMRTENGATGSLRLNSGFALFSDFTNSGVLTADGVSQLRATGSSDADRIVFAEGGVSTVHGTLEVDGRTWFAGGAAFLGSGLIDAVSTVKGTFLQDDADLGEVGLAASGEVHLIGLTLAGASVGSLTMRDTASLHVYFDDFPQPIIAGKLTVGDVAELDGTLVLEWSGNGAAPVGHTVTVLEAGTIAGSFDAVDDSGLGFNRRAHVTVDADSVDVFVTCWADLNADGQTNFFDYSEFLARFNSLDPAADLNEDGQFNFFDVSLFLGMADLGC